MKTILLVLAVLCLAGTGFGQKENVEPFYIGDRIPDLPLNRIINYKDSSATLSSFGEKLIILDFWGIHCGSCIQMFPFEDSVQQAFNDKLQIILVTSDPKEKVIAFFKKWDSAHHSHFQMPIVCEDSVLSKLFRLNTIPHYVWISPEGSLLGQTENKYFMDAAIIKHVMNTILQTIKEMQAKKYPKSLTQFRKPSPALLKAFEENKFQLVL